ncbi:MAG: LLM class flavin-dependent oxidoreductase [Alphaproteobacteria bacterium]|nr:LLM class flavin-dependent oxidoreductase [Alphaproteobacteria bacterium]
MTALQFGIMNRGQFPIGDDPKLHWDELVEQARAAERLKFDSIMKGSHYSSWPLMDFQQVPFLARMSGECPSLRLLCGICLLPLHKPLDVAETFANLDVMSGGKLIFGVGLGYREVEFKAFGTTQKDAVPRFVESLDAIRRLWTEERVTMKGSHFELIEAACTVKPIQKPTPPVWVGANADRAIERAARLTDAWFINPHNTVATTARQMEVYKRALDKAGKPMPAELPMMREVVVGRSREEAIRTAEPYLMAKYRAYKEWGQDKVMPEGDGDFGQDYEDLLKDRFLFGSPDEVAEQIIGYINRFGINHFVFGIQYPGMPQSMVLDEMAMLAEEVIPMVRSGV